MNLPRRRHYFESLTLTFHRPRLFFIVLAIVLLMFSYLSGVCDLTYFSTIIEATGLMNCDILRAFKTEMHNLRHI